MGAHDFGSWSYADSSSMLPGTGEIFPCAPDCNAYIMGLSHKIMGRFNACSGIFTEFEAFEEIRLTKQVSIKVRESAKNIDLPEVQKWSEGKKEIRIAAPGSNEKFHFKPPFRKEL